MNIVEEILIQGLMYSVLALGVMISYKVLDIPDLTVDGSFPLGVVVSAICITQGLNPWISLFTALFAGFLAGVLTGILHVKLRISALLSGILTMTALYSINLVIAQGKSNIPLFQENTLFSNITNAKTMVLLLAVIVLLIKLLLDILLSTRFGYLLKITGDNAHLVNVLGHDLNKVKVIGLGISNALVALSGALAASINSYYDISMGTGMVVLGLSSVILGSVIFNKASIKSTTRVIIGAIAYRAIISIALSLNMNPQLMKLATVIIFIIAIYFNNRQEGAFS